MKDGLRFVDCDMHIMEHFDSNFPHVSTNLLKNVSREVAAQIFLGGAHLYGFGDEHFARADAAAAPRAGHDGGRR